MFDQYRLAEPLAKPLREQTADEIRTAARRRTGHDPERAPAIAARPPGQPASRPARRREGERASACQKSLLWTDALIDTFHRDVTTEVNSEDRRREGAARLAQREPPASGVRSAALASFHNSSISSRLAA